MTTKPAKSAATANRESSRSSSDLFSSTPVEVQSTHTAEIVFALCGPIGAPLHRVSNLLSTIFKDDFDYECKIIRLSEIIEEHEGSTASSTRFERVKSLIDKGNELRHEHGSSILADMAISKIAFKREQFKTATESKKYEPRRICHIIDSIKNQEELDALRLVYRNMLYFIGVYSPLPIRETNLENEGMSLPEVYQLIDRDSGEEIQYGQTVRDTFPLADLFLRIDNDSDAQIKTKLNRFLNLIFDTDIVTPSSDEIAMYVAASAAGSSACLSRQVGAALTDKQGEIISVGWNDVPKAGGNLYQFRPDVDFTSAKDKRCMHLDGGKCFNDKEKGLLAKEIISELVNEGIIQNSDIESAEKIVRSSKVKGLIEFSRSVHAEMHAIILGSQAAGGRVKDGRLYCTTYPCHSCARHIILAGIKEVYYIEPYRKSLAIKLHSDAITEHESEKDKVRILPFDGVAPSRYLELFRMKPDSRKEDVTGDRTSMNKKLAAPKSEVTLESLPALEGIIVRRLASKKLIEIEQLPAEDSSTPPPGMA